MRPPRTYTVPQSGQYLPNVHPWSAFKDAPDEDEIARYQASIAMCFTRNPTKATDPCSRDLLLAENTVSEDIGSSASVRDGIGDPIGLKGVASSPINHSQVYRLSNH